MASKLSPNFMAELFKLMFLNIEVTRVAVSYLEYTLIPKEWAGYKFLLKEAIEQFQKGNVVPSLGVASQKFASNQYVQETIEEIKKAKAVDQELILDQLESFIKETEFEILSKKVFDLYNEGKKEEAMKLNFEESKRILDLSLRKDSGSFVQVFGGFKERMKNRINQEEQNKKSKVPFGIDKLDEICYGGADPGDTVLWIMRSGVGKSTVLRWHGYYAAVTGFSVLHIQLEGGRDECVDRYDQIWTNQAFLDIKNGNIKAEDQVAIEKAALQMQQFKKDISVYGFARYGESSMDDVKNLCYEYEKVFGHFPEVVILDSIDLVASGTNKKMDKDPEYLKYKMQRSAQLFKDLMVEIKSVGITAAQTGDIPPAIWNNEEKVIDRSYTEGDKTLVKPFSFVFTGNMTSAEKKLGKMRIFIDKLRNYKDSNMVFAIATDYDRGRIYNRKKSISMYSDSIKEINDGSEENKSKPSRNKSTLSQNSSM